MPRKCYTPEQIIAKLRQIIRMMRWLISDFQHTEHPIREVVSQKALYS